MKPIISAGNLNFTYNKGKDNEYQALINISLEIYPEEYIVIFGPSGCGKSTLLNVVAGLEKPDNGTISVFDRDLMSMNQNEFAMYHRKQVGMVFQQYNLITSLTVLDNVALPQLFVNVRKGKRNKWARQLLERFGILKQANKIPTELSGGQQQRIGIARSIVNNPKIILADEPVGNLDSQSAKNVLEILSDLNEKEKKTIILVTHNPENIIYADRIIYMKDGIITREVVNKEKNKEKKEKKYDGHKSPTKEISDLMRAYHGLSPEQINILIMPYKAKVFAHHFISSRNMEETSILEEIIQRRLLGTISQDELFDILKRNLSKGGVGFDTRTAEKILRRVNRLIRMAYYVYQKGRQRLDTQGEHEVITEEEKSKKLTDYLLKTCYYEYYEKLDEVQINRIRKAVKKRLLGEMQKIDFQKSLDDPFKKGGVGLNSKTAKAMSEEIELILILGFGIVQMKHNKNNKNNNKKDLTSNQEMHQESQEKQEYSKQIDIDNEGIIKPSDTEAVESREEEEKNKSEEEVEKKSEEEVEGKTETNIPSPPKSLQDAINQSQEKEESQKHKDYDINKILNNK